MWNCIATKMFESTSLVIYTLFYNIASVCFVFRTVEFVSNGLTVESLFRTVIVKEYDNFVLHHIQRTSSTIIVYSSLPLGLFKIPSYYLLWIINNVPLVLFILQFIYWERCWSMIVKNHLCTCTLMRCVICFWYQFALLVQ